MKSILILTKNLIAEQTLQEDLQRLGYQVFIVKQFYDENRPSYLEDLLNFFDLVIFSETFTDKEFHKLLLEVIRKEVPYLRRTDDENSRIGDNHYMPIKHSLVELRESLATDVKKEVQKKSYMHVPHLREQLDEQALLFFLGSLTTLEEKMIEILADADQQLLMRDALCRQLWQGEVTKSRLVQLSTSVNRIRKKMEQTTMDNVVLKTFWGKGYCLQDCPPGWVKCSLNKRKKNVSTD